MSQSFMNNQRVMAIAPCTAGFGFVVLESPKTLIAYGVKGVQGDKNCACLKKVASLIEYYQPDVILTEHPTGKGSRRCRRVQELLWGVTNLAASKKVKARSFSRPQIIKTFCSLHAFSKYQIACAIAAQFSELALRLPPPRRPWMSEDKRMSIFDAAALVLMLFDGENMQGEIA